MDTNGCIEHFTKETDIPPEVLETIIPPAIDAIYAARDEGHFMHFAGASAAVAAYQALQTSLGTMSATGADSGSPAASRRPVHGGRPGV